MTSRPLGRSVYAAIADEVRAQITSGEYPPGSRLPSEDELMTKYQVSRPTVNKALQELRQEGLIEVRRGVGTFVADSLVRITGRGLLTFIRAHVADGGTLLLRQPDGTIRRIVIDD